MKYSIEQRMHLDIMYSLEAEVRCAFKQLCLIA
jgi:hypothetical protein